MSGAQQPLRAGRETRGAPEFELSLFLIQTHTRAVDVSFDLASLGLHSLFPLPDGTLLPLTAFALSFFGALFGMPTVDLVVSLGIVGHARLHLPMGLEVCTEELFS